MNKERRTNEAKKLSQTSNHQERGKREYNLYSLQKEV